MQHSIIGFDLTGDHLLQGDFVSLQQGLTVLYGLNGAGKTRLAAGIRGALTGVETDVGLSLIISLPVPSARDVSADHERVPERAPGSGFLIAIAERLALPGDFSVADPSFLELQAASRVVDRFIDEQFEGSPEALRNEVASERLFMVHPTGTVQSPSWNAWPVARASGPRVTEAVAVKRQAQDEFNIKPDDDDDLDEVNEILWSTPIRGDFSGPMMTTTGRSLEPSEFVSYSNDIHFHESHRGILLTGPFDIGIDVLPAIVDPDLDTNGYLGEISVKAAALEAYSVLSEGDIDTSVRDVLASGLKIESALSMIDGVTYRAAGSMATHADAEQWGRIAARVESLVDRVVFELEARAQTSISQMMLDAPRPVLVLTPSVTRFIRPAVRWLFQRPEGGQLVKFQDLSRAEQVWAASAVAEGIYWHRREHTIMEGDELRPVVAILDEPEAALHRSAEAHTSQALVERSKDPRQILIAATHSPELLNADGARIIEVRRGGAPRGRSLVQELDPTDLDALADLGLLPSDLLRRTRAFLLVEGAHDEALIDELFGDRLRRARVQILPLRGATKLAGTIDSRVLFDFTSAVLVALLDNQDIEEVREAWRIALTDRATKPIEEVTSALADNLTSQNDETRFMREWLTSALRKGVEGRVLPYGLIAKDVIEYVPPGTLIDTDLSWQQLRAAHQEAVRSTKGTPRDFKKWMELTYRVAITPQQLREAAQSLGTIPTELERLMKTLEAVAIP